MLCCCTTVLGASPSPINHRYSVDVAGGEQAFCTLLLPKLCGNTVGSYVRSDVDDGAAYCYHRVD